MPSPQSRDMERPGLTALKEALSGMDSNKGHTQGGIRNYLASMTASAIVTASGHGGMAA